jgi:hypothetical protein
LLYSEAAELFPKGEIILVVIIWSGEVIRGLSA